ncbi:MAG: hypothetical protein ACRBC3_21940 [Burkholderiaceae bacterium]
MNQSTIASTIATLVLGLALSGCGSSDSHAAQTNQVESTETALSSDSVINLNAAFSQSLNCSSGIKPYADPAISGLWSLSFDADQLQFIGPATAASGRFSTSGHPVQRTETAPTATQETILGQTGGRLWFERHANGAVVSAGLTGRADGTSIECGEIADTQWLATPAASPFNKLGEKLFWNTASGIELMCANASNGDLADSTAVDAATLTLTADGPLSVTNTVTGKPVIALPAPQSNGRTASFVHESSRHGGLRVWLSQHDSQPGENIQIHWRLNFSLLQLSQHRQDGSLTRCVPAPLDPRGSITD